MRKLDLYITQDDIDNGVPGNPMRCPAARCLNRAIKLEHHNIKVYTHETQLIPITDDGQIPHLYLKNPRELAVWIMDFDEGNKVFPLPFQLEVPDEGFKL